MGDIKRVDRHEASRHVLSSLLDQVSMVWKYTTPQRASLLVALVLLIAGGWKIVDSTLQQSLAVVGVPEWVGYCVGACEIAGAIGLFVPSLRRATALGISALMVVAFHYTPAFTPIAKGAVAIVFFLSLYIFLASRRPKGTPVLKSEG